LKKKPRALVSASPITGHQAVISAYEKWLFVERSREHFSAIALHARQRPLPCRDSHIIRLKDSRHLDSNNNLQATDIGSNKQT
jgi:hypothetical protein